ncbi:LysR substrate-binding domain-containing protein [Xanthomonas euroxanthea]|uniref:LysR substrate-binding domain-containing protein n=1 Tax=Xanthomonas euroxanthea TaxID=2259622 RepID=UPI001C85848B|nr:LysR substrate-binding domain-containing protein [Xanthomonas euroxanthea]
MTALQIFEAAGRTGSFARAAEELDLSPSAVSHAIRKLEMLEALQLFARSSREVSLTSQGITLLSHVQRGLDEMRQGFSAINDSVPRPLRLHTAPSFATQWLIPRLSRFVADHPDIDLRFSANTDYARFDNDDYDLDVVYGEPARSAHVKMPLTIEELTPLCSPKMAESIRTTHDLYGLPLIQSTGKSMHWPHWFEANNMQPAESYALGFDRSSMAILAAADGLGVVLESTLLTERERSSGRLVAPLLSDTAPIRYVGHHLVYPKRRMHHQAFDDFRHWLISELQASRVTLQSEALNRAEDP